MVRPGFRTRMVKRIPRDEWLSPNVNQGCVLKMSPTGEILDCMWDAEAINNPTITSMREDRGWLYLGGLTSNRLTRIKLKDADPNWTSPQAYWPRKGAEA
jgi:ribose transport system permease protein